MRKFALPRFRAPIAVLSVLSLALLAGCVGTVAPSCPAGQILNTGGTCVDLSIFTDTNAATECADGEILVSDEMGIGTCQPAPRAFKFVFITSEDFNGDLGGIFGDPFASGRAVGAHTICNRLAAAAGLPGTYKAWLSDQFQDPNSSFIRSALPYKRVDGITVAADYLDLTDGTIDATISITELGTTKLARVWTQTAPAGNSLSSGIGALDDCSGWLESVVGTAREGDSSFTDFAWTSFLFGSPQCPQFKSLYCFEQ